MVHDVLVLPIICALINEDIWSMITHYKQLWSTSEFRQEYDTHTPNIVLLSIQHRITFYIYHLSILYFSLYGVSNKHFLFTT